MIFRIFGDAFAAPMGGTEGVARRHLRGLGMRYDKKIKTENFSEILVFSMYILFLKNLKNRKFRRKKMFFSITFFFEKCDFFDFFENKMFIEKILFFEKISVFHVFSYLMPKSSKWHRVTPPVPPVRQKRVIFSP